MNTIKFHNVYNVTAPDVEIIPMTEEDYFDQMDVDTTFIECEEHEIASMIDEAVEFLQSEEDAFEDLLQNEPMDVI